jgi:hypothetical protein
MTRRVIIVSLVVVAMGSIFGPAAVTARADRGYIAFIFEEWADALDGQALRLDRLSVACGDNKLTLSNIRGKDTERIFYLLALPAGEQAVTINASKTIEYFGHRQIAFYSVEKTILVPEQGEVTICWIALYDFVAHYTCPDYEAGWCERKGDKKDVRLDEGYRFSSLEDFYEWASGNGYRVISNF